MGLGRTSNADAFRRLEWYLTNVVESYDLQLALDALAGRPLYFECSPAASTTNQHLAQLKLLVDSIPVQFSEMKGFAFLCDSDIRIVYGGATKADVERVQRVVLQMFTVLGAQFDQHGLQTCKTSLRIEGFVSSGTGIVREG